MQLSCVHTETTIEKKSGINDSKNKIEFLTSACTFFVLSHS